MKLEVLLAETFSKSRMLEDDGLEGTGVASNEDSLAIMYLFRVAVIVLVTVSRKILNMNV